MIINELFKKDIGREIDGVITIGHEADRNIEMELEEYVVTKELHRYFGEFFKAYNKSIDNYTSNMGVWISGFFGSGKSHFLKILSYLLKNEEVEGKKAIEYFQGKIKDPDIFEDMEKACNMKNDVMLFNIESKSDSDSKSNKDSIVKVFNKVFNEMQGFSGILPWLADLERQMVKDGTYENFKKRFEEISGDTWEDKRDDFYFEEDSIVRALADTTKMSEEAARNWYHKAEENYSLSVEDFAKKVNEYIESQGEDHHVVFLVDEVGQYIGDDIGLMLNLQTVVEDLGTYCGGKAWVVVTSQQDIDSITRVKGNDFSKIQGRFKTRISLSSANVDEVIQKRLLDKKESTYETLKLYYIEKESILKNLITFSDTAEMKNYESSDNFAVNYPFIPYQFKLLQSVFNGIREHSSSGKHLSEGERSLLSGFQESAIKYYDSEVGVLIPFSAFYDTVEKFLDHDIKVVILQAYENNRLTDFDVEVLKLLYLIKYIKEVSGNIENISTLMVDHIDKDKIELKKEIESSLKKLLGETLIQKNGNEYVFLTNEEQDVNKEIKNIDINIDNVVNKVGELIFTGIYTDTKYRYSKEYYFDFNKSIDDKFISTQKYNIGVKVISPYYDIGVELSDQELRMLSSRENNVIIKLPQTSPIIEEMGEILRIETYIRKKRGTQISSIVEEILIRKAREVGGRRERLNTLINNGLREAEIYVNGDRLDVKSKNPVERINEGLRILIENKYNKLGYIQEFTESIDDLRKIISEDDSQMSIIDNTPNRLAVEEVNKHIEKKSRMYKVITMRSILDHFSDPPYGWKDLDIQAIILRLFKDQEVKFQIGSEYINIKDEKLVDYINKQKYQERLVIQEREKISKKYIANARNLSNALFNRSYLPEDEDGIMDILKDLMTNELNIINDLLNDYKRQSRYPGKEVILDGKEAFEELLALEDASDFFKKLYELKDELLDYEDLVFDVKTFFKNQKEYFDKALDHLDIYEKNKSYILDEETLDIVKSMEKIIKSKEPYNSIAKLNSLTDKFAIKFAEILEKECEPVKKIIEDDRDIVLKEIEIYPFKDKFYSSFKANFEDMLDRIETVNSIPEAIAMKEESNRYKERAFKEIEEEKRILKRKREKEVEPESIKTCEPKKYDYEIKETEIIKLSKYVGGTRTIKNNEELEELLKEIERDLKRQLDNNKIIRLI